MPPFGELVEKIICPWNKFSSHFFCPKMFAQLILLLLDLILLPIISPIPFNRFPVTSHGISQLSNVMLAQYQQELAKLEGKVREIERSIVSTEERSYKLHQIIGKNGIKDEAEFEYLRNLVRWEIEKRNAPKFVSNKTIY